MTTTETVNTGTDSVPNTDLPKSENSLNQESISLYGHLFLAALSEGEDIKKAINPEEKLDLGTVDAMRGKRLTTAEVERKYNPIVNGLSVHERTEKWKDKSFEEAYTQWSSNLLESINQSESQERKDFINKFFGKDFSEVKDEDVKLIYDKYCQGESNVDDFVKKAVEDESSSVEVEWLAKKLFGTKSGETVRKIYEIEADVKKAVSIDNAIQKANERFWITGLDRFNNPNKDEEELLRLLFTHFKNSQENTNPDPSTEPKTTSSENPELTETEKSDEDNEGAPPSSPLAEPTTTPEVQSPEVVSPPVLPESSIAPDSTPETPISEPNETEQIDEDNEGAPPSQAMETAKSPEAISTASTESAEPADKSLAQEQPSTQAEPSTPINEPEPISVEPPVITAPEVTADPNIQPPASSWPPAEAEPIKASSLVEKIKGIFKKQ